MHHLRAFLNFFFLGNTQCFGNICQCAELSNLIHPLKKWLIVRHNGRTMCISTESQAVQLDEINGHTYSLAARKSLYVNEHWLPSEASLLLDFNRDILECKILELGAGSGRLASVLNLRASKYIATDISPDMVLSLRDAHPTVEAMVADARKLDSFPDGSFNTVIFSFNGIDSLPFIDRGKALAEIHRVLCTGGAFIHSTHNLEHAARTSHRPSIADACRSLPGFFRRLMNRHRLARYEIFSSEFALVNDRALDNGLLNVYIDPQVHLSQLRKAGFVVDAVYYRSGCRLPENKLPDDQWYYLVARKTEAVA